MEEKEINVKEIISDLNAGNKTIEDLTDEEKSEILTFSLKEARMTYKPNKVYGRQYKETRRKKNKQARKARKRNR